MTEIVYEYRHEAEPEPVSEAKECEECAAMRDRIAELESLVVDLKGERDDAIGERDDAIGERDSYSDMIDKIREIV